MHRFDASWRAGEGSPDRNGGTLSPMKRVVRRRIRRSGDGCNLVADVSAVVVTGPGVAEASQHVRVDQSGGRAAGDVTVEADAGGPAT